MDDQKTQYRETKSKKPKVVVWLPLIIALSMAIGVFVGNLFTKHDGGGHLKPIFRRNLNKIDVLFDYMNQAYVDTVNINEIIEQTLPTIISTLDPHSAYITAEDMRSTGTELEGHFGGIGVEFMIQDDTIQIVNVTLGGPSEAVGIMSGDKIVMVNDSTFAGIGLSNMKVLKTLRGPKGTKVKIGVRRASSEDVLDFVVTRADVPVNSLQASYMLGENIGYIKIDKFAITTYDEFVSAVAKLKKEGATSFILDLQQNTGGYMVAANLLTNEFLQKGDLIVYTEGRVDPRKDYVADGTGVCKDDEIVVLIDEGSASASEIFAGAIQDHDRGLLVGRRTFGKGLVQDQYQFPDESAIRLTIARYHTPSGRYIQKPYERGNRTDYDMDIWNRYARGEFDNQDSIKNENLPIFHTKSGRPVYGNGGVTADVFVPRDTTGINSYYVKVVNSGVFRDFAFKYASQNREKLKEMKSWEEAYKYLQTVPLVDNLVSYAESKQIRRRPVLIAESRSLLKNQLEAFVLRDVFSDNNAFYKVYQQNDKVINKAVELINAGKASPEAVAEELYILERK